MAAAAGPPRMTFAPLPPIVVTPTPTVAVPVPSVTVGDKGKEAKTLDLQLLSESNLNFTFLLSNSTARIAVQVRRILITQIPTMAIDCVEIHDNTSVIQDEMLAASLGRVVFTSSTAANFPLSRYCDCPELELSPINVCEAEFWLIAENLADHILQVTSKDLLPTDPQNGVFPVIYTLSDGKGGTVESALPLVQLLPNQKIKIRCLAKKGLASQHVKWSPVSVVGLDDAQAELGGKGNFVFTAERMGSLTAQELLTSIAGIYSEAT